MTTSAKRVLVPAGVQECWAEASGVRVRYLRGGSGPPLLFVHGLIGFSFSWSENLQHFSRDFTVIALDLPNMGHSQRAVVGCTLRDVAAFLLQFMQRIGFERFSLIGSSHGGAASLVLAATAPGVIEKLVLVSPPNPASEERLRWRVRLFASFAGPLGAWLVCNAPLLFWREAVARQYGDRRKMLAGTAAGYGKTVRGRETAAHLVRLVRGWDQDMESMRALPDKVTCPTLLVWGDRDRLVPLETAEWLRGRLPNARLEIVHGAGHLPYEEDPEAFNGIVLRFLREQTAIS